MIMLIVYQRVEIMKHIFIHLFVALIIVNIIHSEFLELYANLGRHPTYSMIDYKLSQIS